MGSFVRGVGVATLALLFLFSMGSDDSCVPVEPVDPGCASPGDCAVGEVCREGACVAAPVEGERCEGMGGVCGYFLDACPDSHFEWTGLDCPMGRSGMCCLPYDASCEGDLDGRCIFWTEECPGGTGGVGPMDCPWGRSSQCCVPLE